MRPDTVAVSLVFAAVFKDKTRIWNLYTSPNSEVLIWKLCFRAPEGKVRFSDIGVDRPTPVAHELPVGKILEQRRCVFASPNPQHDALAAKDGNRVGDW